MKAPAAQTLLVLLALAAAVLGPKACAQAADAQASVQSGRQALGSHWSYPWYDEATDGIRSLNIEPEKTEHVERRSSTHASGGESGSVDVLVMTIAAVVLSAIAILLVRAFLKTERATAIAEPQHSRAIDITRIEQLPFQLDLDVTDLLAAARKFYAAGQYGQAMVYLYSHLLLELDRRQMIVLARGKTNRQYLREAASSGEIKELLRLSMIAFEDVFFGHHALARARFEKCLIGLERLLPAERGGA